MLQLACQHTFHAECVLQWLARSGSCPLCKDAVAKASEPDAGGGGDEAEAEGRAGSSSDVLLGLATLLVAGFMLLAPSRLGVSTLSADW